MKIGLLPTVALIQTIVKWLGFLYKLFRPNYWIQQTVPVQAIHWLCCTSYDLKAADTKSYTCDTKTNKKIMRRGWISEWKKMNPKKKRMWITNSLNVTLCTKNTWKIKRRFTILTHHLYTYSHTQKICCPDLRIISCTKSVADIVVNISNRGKKRSKRCL